MKGKVEICKICDCEIKGREPRYYFPRQPQWHDLADLSGIVHVDCIKSIDEKRDIGKKLAYIAEDIACKSEVSPLIKRSGNIVIQGQMDEERVDILDFEDFDDISIPLPLIDRIQELNIHESIDMGLQTIHVLENGNLEVYMPMYSVYHSKLNLQRLKELLKGPEIKDCFENSIYHKMLYDFINQRNNINKK